MRFNKQELIAIACQPSNKFEKEGCLLVTENQETKFSFFRKTEGCLLVTEKQETKFSFFRKTEVSLEKFCRVRGNLLFYFKTNDPFAGDGLPLGCIVLEKFQCKIYNNEKDYDGYAFFLEFDDGLSQRLATHSEFERLEWYRIFNSASYEIMRSKLKILRDQIEEKRGNIAIDINMLRLRTGKEIDLSEIPICESAISCDNLLNYGLPPNPCVVVHVTTHSLGWIKYGQTEIVDKCSNPQFLHTVTFRKSDGLTSISKIKFTVYDVREKFSKTAVVLGNAEVTLGVVQDTFRLRIPLQNTRSSGSKFQENGFITISTYCAEIPKLRSPAKSTSVKSFSHRRSQSLPPKLGIKLFVPSQSKLSLLFNNPYVSQYRFHSGLGGDISVQEMMLESKMCFIIPQQLLSIWILREKELLQEISGIGELGGIWKNKQMNLLDKHLKLLKDYSQAKQNLQQYNGFFKTSAKKTDESLEFAPTNLHLARMWAHNDTLKKTGLLDIMTVGAFTRHCCNMKSGGLVKLLNSTKDKPDTLSHKIHCANETVQAIKQLRKEIVDIMVQLLLLAKDKNSKGMLPLTNQMITKSKMLLNIWDPTLVEEIFAFVEQNRIIEDSENSLENSSTSPFKRITQQLKNLELKSPEMEDFSTPMGPAPDLWPSNPSATMHHSKLKYPSSAEINAIGNFSNITEPFRQSNKKVNEYLSQSLPVTCNKFSETHFDVNGEISSIQTEMQTKKLDQKIVSNENFNNRNDAFINYDENGQLFDGAAIALGKNGEFLDTKNQNSEFYRPSEEPEPLDLTQLNIEASVMCLVSKVKFLCGRCNSPAIRLTMRRNTSDFLPKQDVITYQPEANSSVVHQNPSNMLQNKIKSLEISQKDLNLAVQVVGEVTHSVNRNHKTRNLFTDGLDLNSTTDWTSELRPSMKKLRTAMDGLLKTARLMHSTVRLQSDQSKIGLSLSITYRRNVCFSQALTTLVCSLMAKFWGTLICSDYLNILCNLGPLAYFEGLLTVGYGSESDMFGDMSVAVDDLANCQFTLVRCNITNASNAIPSPRVTGYYHALNILLPVPEYVFCMLPTKETAGYTFKVTPVFFNIGINENATISESLGYTKEQHRSNWDNFDKLKHYHICYKKIYNCHNAISQTKKHIQVSEKSLSTVLAEMETLLRANPRKNVKILHLAEDITRVLQGLRFTSCKSAKDRTSMSVTLEQVRLLENEFHLDSNQSQKVLNTLRSEGSRIENCLKNIGLRKYAFNKAQQLALPSFYRPPHGSYGKAQT